MRGREHAADPLRCRPQQRPPPPPRSLPLQLRGSGPSCNSRAPRSVVLSALISKQQSHWFVCPSFVVVKYVSMSSPKHVCGVKGCQRNGARQQFDGRACSFFSKPEGVRWVVGDEMRSVLCFECCGQVRHLRLKALWISSVLLQQSNRVVPKKKGNGLDTSRLR